jgi:hypothetical protein
MYPNVYLEDSFTKEFDRYVENLPGSKFHSVKADRAKHESLRRIHDLLMSSNVFTDFSQEDVEDRWTSAEGFSSSLKDQIIRSTYKSDTYTDSDRRLLLNRKVESNFSSDFLFFTGDSFIKTVEKSEREGRIVYGMDFLNKSFFLNYTFPSVDTDSTLYQISKLPHPCSSMVVIDKYLFKNVEKLDDKIPNLIQVIEWILPKQLTKKFEVCIITENTESRMTHLISSKFQKIQNHFGDRISLHVFAPGLLKDITTSDRYILTNYALISIPHPFDRPTTISCNFFPSQVENHSIDLEDNTTNKAIIEAFRTWQSKIELAKKIVIGTPLNLGTVQHVWKSDVQDHSIFSNHK